MIANLQKLFISNLNAFERGSTTTAASTSPPTSASQSPSPSSLQSQASQTSPPTSAHLLPSHQYEALKRILMESLPKLNFSIQVDKLEEDALHVVSQVRPEWSGTELQTKIFTDGITNRLIGVYNVQNRNDMVLIRVYGENTDLFIDRAMELRNMRVMHHAGLSAPVYCSFNNGIAYGFSPGVVLDPKTVRDAHISGLVAETLAQMHTLKAPLPSPAPDADSREFHSSVPESCFFISINKFLVLISSAFPVAKGCKKLKSITNIDKLDLEVFFLERELRRINSPIVFCHNDLLLKNIVYNPDADEVVFIDFEYSDYNHQAFDIANHFNEFCGVDDFNASLYPSKDFQFRWLERYLRKWHTLTGIKTEESKLTDEIEQLYDTVSKFTLASHLYWGLWALVQATNSSIDFDYLQYAQQRIGEYFSRKELLFPDECTCRLSAHNEPGEF